MLFAMKKVSKFQERQYVIALIILLALLLAKFLYPLFLFDLPLGYDPGMYRYLFVKYAEVSPSLPELRPWAQEYPYGLFLISSILIKLGVPVSWFLGWIWSVFAVSVLAVFAWIFAKREGKAVGVLILLAGLLSIAYFDGFAQMYWKTYLALLFLIFTFHFFEKKSLWMIPFGALTILSHNQTGLILGLTLIVWWFVHLPTDWKDKSFRKWTLAFVAVAVLGLVWYAPIFFRAFWAPFKSVLLLRGENAPAGHFPETVFFLKNGAVLLVLGLFGWVHSFNREKFSVWLIAPAVCAIFIVFRLVFYNRFFLQLDFFLMPFAGIAVVVLWKTRNGFVRGLLIVLILLQAFISFNQMKRWEPRMIPEELNKILSIRKFVEDDAKIIALENNAAVWLLGWLPEYYTGGPGLFDFPPWTYAQWESFLYGSNQDRYKMISSIHERPLYLMTSDLFYSYYGDHVKGFLKDPCFKRVYGAPLYRVICSYKETEETEEPKETEDRI
jgi:hypothetical protein